MVCGDEEEVENRSKMSISLDAVHDPIQPATQRLTILLAAPRGFCAGVERAIQIVEGALTKFGAPVYVRHEIVHNNHVVERLQAMGAVFVEELDECPNDRPVIFSAHGVPKHVPADAEARQMIYVDATCPLVSKVHIEAERHYRADREILLIGHSGHPEVVGTMGQLPEGTIRLIETVEDAEAFQPRDPDNVAYVTQTTLSMDDVAEIVDVLRLRFPNIALPHKEDICYATSNRQEAVKAIADRSDYVLVVGSPTSSNAKRLVEVALRAGAAEAQLVEDASEIDWAAIAKVRHLGLTAGASTPEELVADIIAQARRRFAVDIEEVLLRREEIAFKLPRILTD